MSEFYVDRNGLVHEYETSLYGREQRKKYELCCKIISTGRLVLQLAGHDIPITREDDKYKGWQGTMKPTY